MDIAVWLMCMAAGMGAVLRLRTIKVVRRGVECGRCGYALEGVRNRCPECGTALADQARVWRMKYRRVGVAVLVVSVVLGYVLAEVGAVRARGVRALVPSAVLVYMEHRSLVAMVVDEDPAADRHYMSGPWWYEELQHRVEHGEIGAATIAWLTRRALELEAREDVRFKVWYYRCQHVVLWAKRLEAVDDRVFLDLAEEHMFAVGRWGVFPGGSWSAAQVYGRRVWPTITLRYESLLSSNEYRNFDYQYGVGINLDGSIQEVGMHARGERGGRPVDLRAHDWDWDQTVYIESTGMVVVRYVLCEGKTQSGEVLLDIDKAFLVEILDGWDENRMAADRTVLQTAAEWDGVGWFNVYGVRNDDGTLSLSGRLRTGVIRDPRFEDLGIGVTATVRVNGKAMFTESLNIETEPYCHGGSVTRGRVDEELMEDESKRFSISGGDVCDIVVKSNRHYALKDHDAARYWEGEVVIPVTGLMPERDF